MYDFFRSVLFVSVAFLCNQLSAQSMLPAVSPFWCAGTVTECPNCSGVPQFDPVTELWSILNPQSGCTRNGNFVGSACVFAEDKECVQDSNGSACGFQTNPVIAFDPEWGASYIACQWNLSTTCGIGNCYRIF